MLAEAVSGTLMLVGSKGRRGRTFTLEDFFGTLDG